jgi:hypothetical protein
LFGNFGCFDAASMLGLSVPSALSQLKIRVELNGTVDFQSVGDRPIDGLEVRRSLRISGDKALVGQRQLTTAT